MGTATNINIGPLGQDSWCHVLRGGAVKDGVAKIFLLHTRELVKIYCEEKILFYSQ